jgi:hypothetical protein
MAACMAQRCPNKAPAPAQQSSESTQASLNQEDETCQGLQHRAMNKLADLEQKKAGTLARAMAICTLISQLAAYQSQTVVWILDSQPAGVSVAQHQKLGKAPHSDEIAALKDNCLFTVFIVEAQVAGQQVLVAPDFGANCIEVIN